MVVKILFAIIAAGFVGSALWLGKMMLQAVAEAAMRDLREEDARDGDIWTYDASESTRRPNNSTENTEEINEQLDF